MIDLALNQKSCKNLPLEQFLKFSKDFYGIELNFTEVKNALLKKIPIREFKELIEMFDLKVCSIFKLKDFSLSSERNYKSKVLKCLKEMVFYCEKFDADLLIVNPSKPKDIPNINDIPKWRIINKTRDRIESISKIADEYDVNIGFEFLVDSSISNLNDAINVIEPLKYQENLGFVIDTFHLFLSDSDYNLLKNIKPLIYLIQLSDLNQDSINNIDIVNKIKDIQRLYPGEGIFNFKNFFNFLHKIGYTKIYSIELNGTECKDNLYKRFYSNFHNI